MIRAFVLQTRPFNTAGTHRPHTADDLKLLLCFPVWQEDCADLQGVALNGTAVDLGEHVGSGAITSNLQALQPICQIISNCRSVPMCMLQLIHPKVLYMGTDLVVYAPDLLGYAHQCCNQHSRLSYMNVANGTASGLREIVSDDLPQI